jgi:hypothetical protein
VVSNQSDLFAEESHKTSGQAWEFHVDGALPPKDGRWVFVFGSNLPGRHGAGAAKAAIKYGAKYYKGSGLHGQSYALPTKGGDMEVLFPLDLKTIKANVEEFIRVARTMPDSMFFVSRVACGLAGFKDAEIAPMFAQAPPNCSFARQWQRHLKASVV